MKTNLSILFLLCSFFCISNGNISLNNKALFFRENKGQVSDQNFRARPDVLFSGADGKLAFHLRRNGISYQLSKSTNLSSNKISEEDFDIPKLGLSALNAYTKLQRVDINWLNCNSKAEIERANAINGYENFYSEVCPNGVLNVRSYKEVTYKNLYPGIDLKWYEKDGQLKYDYLVAAGADYKAIVLEINGAEKIFIDTNGALCFSTILGDIYENAPLVIQAGKILKAKWVLENNKATFSIENINHNLPFAIDPIVRLWGTYYGGNGMEWSRGIAVDASNNIFISGGTISNNALTIATIGAHQTTLVPCTTSWSAPLEDAYIAKFDASGIRLWATYYGGLGNDQALSCAVNNSGDVVICGNTTTTNNIVVTTAGCHQPLYGGGTSNQFIGDAFLVKFNPAGVRIWGTYFGGTGEDIAFKVIFDVTENIFIVGETSSGNSNAIASPSAHQTSLSGHKDGFMAKFSSSGIKLWSSYYGGTEFDNIEACALDIYGNFFVVGSTASSQNISTAACHQFNYGGGALSASFTPGDAFLAKFDSTGVRQWGTYYGGSGVERGNDISCDSLGNIYISGSTSTGSSTVIATPGSHQSVYAGGGDAMLVKFNNQGSRQWGSYYGGPGVETGGCYVINKSTNIFISGNTNNYSLGSIATPCAYQSTFAGGGSDAYIAKFSLNGSRYWGSYYGGGGKESCDGIAADSQENIFITGTTGSQIGNSIASVNSHQPTYGGSLEDAFLVKFSPCVPVTPSNITVANFCAGTETVLSSAESCLLNWYNDSTLTNLIYSGTSFSTGMLHNDTSYFIVDVSCGIPSNKALVTITVVPTPTISVIVTPTLICMGESASIIPSGANTYKWIHTPSNYSVIVYPLITSTYVVTGTSLEGCKSSLPITVFVSDCLGISNLIDDANFYLYPNPANSSFRLNYSGSLNNVISYNVTNIIGKNIAYGSITKNYHEIVTENFANGVYFISVTTNGSLIGTKKIIVSKQ